MTWVKVFAGDVGLLIVHSFEVDWHRQINISGVSELESSVSVAKRFLRRAV